MCIDCIAATDVGGGQLWLDWEKQSLCHFNVLIFINALFRCYFFTVSGFLMLRLSDKYIWN